MLRKLITENKTDAKKQNTTFNRGNKLSYLFEIDLNHLFLKLF